MCYDSFVNVKKSFQNRGVAFIVFGLFAVLAVLLIFISLQGGIGKYIKTDVGDYGPELLPYFPNETPPGKPIPTDPNSVTAIGSAEDRLKKCEDLKVAIDVSHGELFKVEDRKEDIDNANDRLAKALEDMGVQVGFNDGPDGVYVGTLPAGQGLQFFDYSDKTNKLYGNMRELKELAEKTVAINNNIDERLGEFAKYKCQPLFDSRDSI